ncbi:2-iminobutanoate/2-iminopropanoate deaminase [Daejeonella rubra]|uniref:2-iminobutanoate/2-iminopropanoate deaminase n=1 Tax=Daejeonella rubra TaxID=990371 RepID=A0A1G9NVG9_9SPHI|nr:Rid family hydrolase [Daejeonella rubra]SDL90389.1 2-iminobutanoate/2-iminopropanoate deaminase [Daejeonella rubra]
MEKREIQHPDKADKTFSTGAYSAGVMVAGDWLFVSGQAAVDFTTSSFVLGTIEEETHLTIHNVKRICEAAGFTLDDIVKCTVHLSDIKDFDRYNAVYASYFTKVKPARTTVQSGLGHGIKVEIDAIAFRKGDK